MAQNVGNVYVGIKGDSSGLTASLATARTSAMSAANGISTSFGNMKNTFTSLVASINPVHVALAAITASAAAVGIALKSSVQTGMNFESTMTTVKAVSGATAGEFLAMEAAAREMGATTEWSAQQSAGALKFMSMAGLTAGESIQALPGMLNFATAAQMDLAESTDLVTDTIGAFQLGIGGLTRASDIYVFTANSTNTTVAQMGEAIKEVGATANNFGYDMEAVSGMLGILGNNMIKGGNAGTALKNSFINNKRAAKALGLAIDTDLITTLEALNNSNMSDFEKSTFIFEKYGKIAGNAVVVLANYTKQVKAQTAATREAAGETQRIADIIRGDLSNQFDLLKSGANEAGISIYKVIREDVGGAIVELTEFVTRNKEVFVDWAGKIMYVTEPLFGALVIGAGLVADAFNGWSMVWDVVKLGAMDMALGVSNAQLMIIETTGKVMDALPGMENTFGDSIASIKRKQKEWNDEIDATKDHLEKLSSGGSNAVAYFGKAVDDAKRRMGGLNDEVSNTGDAANKSVGAATGAVKSMGKEAVGALSGLASAQKELFETGKTQISGYGKQATRTYGIMKNASGDWVVSEQRNVATVKEAHSKVKESQKWIADGYDVAKDASGVWRATASGDAQAIESSFKKSFSGVSGSADTMGSRFDGTMSGMETTAKGTADAINAALSDAFGDLDAYEAQLSSAKQKASELSNIDTPNGASGASPGASSGASEEASGGEGTSGSEPHQLGLASMMPGTGGWDTRSISQKSREMSVHDFNNLILLLDKRFTTLDGKNSALDTEYVYYNGQTIPAMDYANIIRGDSAAGANYATGGVINRVYAGGFGVPAGEDGFIAAQLGEGVISKTGMEALDRLNVGGLPSTRDDEGERTSGSSIAIGAAISGLANKIDNLGVGFAQIKRKVTKWDRDGLPPTRAEIVGA